jgi:hypothetical protein
VVTAPLVRFRHVRSQNMQATDLTPSWVSAEIANSVGSQYRLAIKHSMKPSCMKAGPFA